MTGPVVCYTADITRSEKCAERRDDMHVAVDDYRIGFVLATIGALLLGLSWGNSQNPDTSMIEDFLFMAIGGGTGVPGFGIARGKLLLTFAAAFLAISAGLYISGYLGP